MADSTGGGVSSVSSATSKNISNLDVSKLTALSPEVIAKQATINIGTIGHVAHGKSTVVKALSGVQTVRFKNELERNITIKLDRGEGGSSGTMASHDGGGGGGGDDSDEEQPHSTQTEEEGEMEVDEDLELLADLDKTLKEIDTQRSKSPARPAQVAEDPTLPDSPTRGGGGSRTASVTRHVDSPTSRALDFTGVDSTVKEESKTAADGSFSKGTGVKKGVKIGPKSKMVKESKEPENDAVPQIKEKEPESRASRMIEKVKEFEKVKESESRALRSREETRESESRALRAREEAEDESRWLRPKDYKPGTSGVRIYLAPQSSSSEEEEEALPPPPKKPNRRKTRTESTNSNASDSSDSKKRGNKRDKKDPWANRSYKSKRMLPKRKPAKSSRTRQAKAEPEAEEEAGEYKSVTRETPSETRQVDVKSVDYDIGRQDDGEYEVEIVLNTKKIEGREYYLVKWRGWPEEWNTWEPMENLVHSQEALLVYFRNTSARALERIEKLNANISRLAIAQKLIAYERDVVMGLGEEDFKGLEVGPMESLSESLPSPMLLSSHISKLLKLREQSKTDSELEAKSRKMIVAREFARLRFEQLEALARWEKEMVQRAGEEGVPITIQNNVDLEGPQDNFHFVKKNLPGEGVTIPEEPPVGCECSTCDSSSACCGQLSGSKFAYTPEGRLSVEHGTPVYECNKRCSCGPDCPNRVLQKGRTVPLLVYRTSNSCGWGVKVQTRVSQGTFICEYIGEVVTRETADKRMKSDYKNRPLYIFDLDFNDNKDFPYTVDAYQYGNVSHFINHSCEPNLAVYSVWVDCLDPNLPRLGMYAIRDIEEGEEITFDYSAQYHRGRKKNGKSGTSKTEGEAQKRRPNGKTPCRCGSKMCRGIMF